MNEMSISKPDEITMRLVHYFVTKENYQPIIVNGLDNEIWLENLDKDYSVIRINANYIHNKEQLDFDKFKASSVIKQIKKKTLSLSMNCLTITLNTDYTIKYSREQNGTETEDLKNAGTIYMTIEGKGDYEGTINKTYEINKRKVTLNPKNIMKLLLMI